MIQLIINGETFSYPENRDSPSWGEEATAWAQAVTTVLASIVNNNDILLTPATILNAQSSPVNIVGLNFDATTVRGAIVSYCIQRRTTGSGATETVETGTMYLSYLSSTNTWDIVVVGGASAGVTFTITAAGQLKYTSTTFTGSAYTGTIKFRAQAFLQ